MNTKTYALLALLAMAALPTNTSALMVQTTCPSELLNVEESMSASVQAPVAIDEPASESTATTREFRCGGGSRDGGDPDFDPDAWVEYIENIVGDVEDLNDLVPEECNVATAALPQPLDLPRMPQQSADIGEVCQAVKDTEIPGTGPHKGPTCEKGENDHNLGGTHVHCEYSCPETSLLGIKVTAEDHDATAYGETDCGGANAKCDNGTWTCADVSKGLTRFGEYDQRCNGNSEEFVDSRVTVSCYAVGPDSALCAIDPMFCDLGVNVAMQDFCVEANPLLANASREAVGPLFPATLPTGIVSMVSYWYEATGGLAVRFEVDHLGGVSCIAQAFTL